MNAQSLDEQLADYISSASVLSDSPNITTRQEPKQTERTDMNTSDTTTTASAQPEKAIPADVMIKPGFGYWDVTTYPIGGDFHRVGQLAMLVKLTGPIGDYGKGCNAKGETANRRTICFDINHTIKVNP